MFAIWHGQEHITYELLSKKNININYQNNHGSTALLLSSEKNHTDIAIKLINMGANVNVQDKDNDAPILYATKNKNIILLEALLKAKASLNINKQNETIF